MIYYNKLRDGARETWRFGKRGAEGELCHSSEPPEANCGAGGRLRLPRPLGNKRGFSGDPLQEETPNLGLLSLGVGVGVARRWTCVFGCAELVVSSHQLTQFISTWRRRECLISLGESI
jgi:hypothetical protein